MWEEHPEYQKQQAKLIGVLLMLGIVIFAARAFLDQDWEQLKQIFLFAGAFVVALALLVGIVLLVVRIFTRRRSGELTSKQQNND